MLDMSEQQNYPSPVIPEWTLGWRMNRALDHAGIDVGEMADELGVSRSTASRWLHDKGKTGVRDIYLKQWALRTGVPFAWLKRGETIEGVTTSSLSRPLRRASDIA